MTEALPSDTEWLERLRRGEVEALPGLFDRYRPRLRRMIDLRMDRRLAARIDPSDVLQETYLDARRQVEGFVRQPRVSLYVWLRGLAWERLLNLHRDHLRAQRRTVEREVRLPEKSSLILARRLLTKRTSPSQALLRKEMRQRTQDAVSRLLPRDREVILLRHFEGMSNGEVAQTLDLSDSAATMRYGRAVMRLKELLLEEFKSGEPRP